VHKWPANDADEISFEPGDVIASVVKAFRGDASWWVGTAPSGQRGSFPSNYVKLLDKAEAVALEAQATGGRASDPDSDTGSSFGAPGDPNVIDSTFYDSADGEQYEVVERASAAEEDDAGEPCWMVKKVGAGMRRRAQLSSVVDSYIRAKHAGMLHREYARAVGILPAGEAREGNESDDSTLAHKRSARKLNRKRARAPDGPATTTKGRKKRFAGLKAGHAADAGRARASERVRMQQELLGQQLSSEEDEDDDDEDDEWDEGCGI
jgi:hypothetical protein